MKRFDVIALGELLIDFTESGNSAQGNPLLEVNPGGAPCNVLAMLQNLGRSTAFIGKVGKDLFGAMLKQTVEEIGVNTENLVEDRDFHTTLTFVHTKEDGDREFSFYRNPGADSMLKPEEVQTELIADAKVFHFGTLSLTHEPARTATEKALKIAGEEGLLISFDPNLRPPLWESLEMAREQICWGLGRCDLLKISEEELEFVTGTADIDAGVEKLRQKYPIPLICVTMGRNGSRAYYRDLRVEQEAFLQSGTIETTGAGDTFCANMIDGVLRYGLENLTEETLSGILTRANAAAALVTTKKGALKVMPKLEEIDQLIQERK